MKVSSNSHCAFVDRHIGPQRDDISDMLATLGLSTLDDLVTATVPSSILMEGLLDLPDPVQEHEVVQMARGVSDRNQIYRSLIGMGYSSSVTPPVIQRNLLENPGWYTQYTPYQAEISQGRLEAMLNFQTMVSDLTGFPLSNASLLDEATAAAEAMGLCHSARGRKGRDRFFVASDCHPQTIDVVRTRAESQGFHIVVEDFDSFEISDEYFGALIQYPTTDGVLRDYRSFCEEVHEAGGLVVVACDILSLTLFAPPGEWGGDVAVGSSQRFGVPLGFGGPHAAFLSTGEEFRRLIPGRIVGVSKDSRGEPALRLALQTREQHIRRAKATSNICTAQVLLAIMASMYAVYHGPDGLRRIARRIHCHTAALSDGLRRLGFSPQSEEFFDTLRFSVPDLEAVLRRAELSRINLRTYPDHTVGLSLDELTNGAETERILKLVSGAEDLGFTLEDLDMTSKVSRQLIRKSEYLMHPVFNSYRSETELLRYIHRLEARDLSLTHSMIPLGSCTMKLNAAAEMIPITFPGFAEMHPFAPLEQAGGYREMIGDLEQMLGEITGLPHVSLQPNSGAQGEYTGLTVIRGYHRARGEQERTICLIPQSAHGTNPASAVMAGFRVLPVKCDDNGNVDLEDLTAKAEEHGEQLGALMITYPSTHGVFEEAVREICDIVHRHGGQVYMDGANMNALVGLCRPGEFGIDVCHLNLHKTFCIPHGGGGPGVGPIAAAPHLARFLPGHLHLPDDGRLRRPVAAAPWGSAGILPISWAYLRLMGSHGLKRATQVAILNANYIAQRLEEHFPVLYKGNKGRVAHECILDCRSFKRTVGITVADIAKRLMDYGFHAPTVSWPVVETVMVEPTESESKAELDRFCDAMIAIRHEIDEIERGAADPQDNVLKNAPHTAEMVTAEEWSHPYSREKAVYPVAWLRKNKFWTSCGRIDDTYGDRNLFCTCVPVSRWDESTAS